jgi:ubiquinone/menaquinone biosynthesis C-methylase UbiE
MPDYLEIYRRYADQYDALVMREDYQHNIPAALNRIRPMEGLTVVEFGAGTGRLTAMLAPAATSILALDVSGHMLSAAVSRLRRARLDNWLAVVGDNRRVPVGSGVADVAIAGWSFGHATSWYTDRWPEEIGQALAQMKRILKPGGTAIILETLGTGRESPQPPSERLAAYYAWLEGEHHFSSTWIRTDYRFESLAEAESLTRFFFGDALAERVVAENLVILPECTGIWWLTV